MQALLSVYKFDAKVRARAVCHSDPAFAATRVPFAPQFSMLGFQLLIALLLCGVLKRWFAGVPGLEVPDFNWDSLIKSIPPGLLFTLNMVIGGAVSAWGCREFD